MTHKEEQSLQACASRTSSVLFFMCCMPKAKVT